MDRRRQRAGLHKEELQCSWPSVHMVAGDSFGTSGMNGANVMS